MSNVAKLVSFGRGGDVVHYGRGSRCSGYGSPERPHAATDIPDGVLAIDKRQAVETPEGVRLAISGPMVNVDLGSGEVERLSESMLIVNPMVTAMVGAPGNEYGALAVAHLAARALKREYGPLDYVEHCDLRGAVA